MSSRTVTCKHCDEETELDSSKSVLECDECGERTMVLSNP